MPDIAVSRLTPSSAPLTTQVVFTAFGTHHQTLTSSVSVCLGEKITNIDVRIPEVPGRPDIPAEICIALRDPKQEEKRELSIDEKLSLIPQSNHPNEGYRLDQIDNASRLAEQARLERVAAIKRDNLLIVITELGKEFGFEDVDDTFPDDINHDFSTDFPENSWPNPRPTPTAESDAITMVRVGLSASPTAKNRLPTCQAFINMIYEFAQQEALAEYLPPNMKFWVFMEGEKRKIAIAPDGDEEAKQFIEHHPEMQGLLKSSALQLSEHQAVHHSIDPRIGVLGIETMDSAQMATSIRQHAASIPNGLPNTPDICEKIWGMLRRAQYTHPVVQGDKSLPAYADSMMNEMYGRHNIEEGVYTPVTFFAAEAKRLQDMPELAPAPQFGPLLGRGMDKVLHIPPSEQSRHSQSPEVAQWKPFFVNYCAGGDRREGLPSIHFDQETMTVQVNTRTISQRAPVEHIDLSQAQRAIADSPKIQPERINSMAELESSIRDLPQEEQAIIKQLVQSRIQQNQPQLTEAQKKEQRRQAEINRFLL
jgi:hypothetical protein